MSPEVESGARAEAEEVDAKEPGHLRVARAMLEADYEPEPFDPLCDCGGSGWGGAGCEICGGTGLRPPEDPLDQLVHGFAAQCSAPRGCSTLCAGTPRRSSSTKRPR